MKKYLLLLLVVSSLISTDLAFSQQIKFNKVLDGEKYGFANILSIAQDQKGFIWFTSVQKGLQRYDGKKITSYSHNNDNPNSLSSNLALAVAVDSSGNIWVGTLGTGLDRFDPETKKFTHFRHDPNDPTSLGSDTIFVITTDHSGTIWIGTTRTLDKFNPATGKFTHYIIDELFNIVNTSSEFISINAILEDREGNLWTGWGDPFTGKKDGIGGLARLDRTSGKFIQYKHDPANPNSLSDNNVFAIYEDSKNNLWVCTKGNGLQTLDRTTGKFTHYDYFDPAHTETISRPPNGGSEMDLVTFVTEDAKGRIWIGSSTGGINMYDPLLKRTTHFGNVSNDKTDQFANDTLSGFTDSSAVRSFTSRDGLLWIISDNGNVHNVDFSGTTIPFISLDAAAGNFYYEEDKNVLWILSDIGIIRKNLLNNQQKVYKHDPQNPNSLVSMNVFNMLGDNEGNIWMANHFHGLDKFNINTEQFTNIRHDTNNSASLVNDSTHVLLFDREHYLWIGTHNGLSRMDTKTGICTNYINDPNDSLSLAKGHINSIAQDKNDVIWIGTDVDMYSLDIKTGKFKRYTIGTGQITNICVDETGKIWASGVGGLYFFDKQKNVFKKFTTQVFPEGIENIWGMVEDDKGNLWLSTSENIIKINKERDALKIYNAAQGVQPLTGRWLKNIRTKDGSLILGGTKGYYTFKPDELIDERTEPLLNFTNLKIGSQEIVVGEGSVLKAPIWKTNRIELSYWENTISFEFQAIDYKSRGDIKYFYKLENYDNEWRDIGTEHKATFFNLPSGKYILYIKAANNEGSVSEKRLDITITPPWWKTWWAYCLYAIFVIVAGYLIYKYQKYYIVKRERERTQQIELAQAKEIEKAYTELKVTQAQLIQSEKMASLGELTAGIAHEIQNPLNFVNNFSEVNAELISEMKVEIEKGNIEEVKAIANDIEVNEQKIIHHGKRADAIVKGMLQHRRSSNGMKEPTNINALADEYLRLAYHGLRAKDKSFNATMKTDFDESIGNINVVPQDIGRVILNLITNAFYVVDEKKKQKPEGYEPTVSVSTKKIGDKVEVRVKDNGNGVPQKVIDKIFQPFYTTKPTGQGTGLGLSLSYDIVKAHGGELKVETIEGEGSEFII
jgi:signal transduction histidine kinase/ligand-binding sensor domain-containing protein